MFGVLLVILPVFLVVGSGYAMARGRLIPAAGVDGLLAFTVRFAVPVFLFRALYGLDLAGAFDWRLLTSFYAGAIFSFYLAAFLARRFWGRRPGESIAIGFGAFYSNSILMGLPIMERAYGPEALEPMYGIVALHAPVCYVIGISTMEALRRDGAGVAATARSIGRSVFTNGLMLGIVAGLLANLAGLVLPDFLIAAVDLVSEAALPVALFGLGGALTRYAMKRNFAEAGMVSTVSLLVHPLIALILSRYAFGLPEEMVRAAVVTAAMPAGLNAYLFAAMYGRALATSAGVIILATLASVVTIALWLSFLGGANIN